MYVCITLLYIYHLFSQITEAHHVIKGTALTISHTVRYTVYTIFHVLHKCTYHTGVMCVLHASYPVHIECWLWEVTQHSGVLLEIPHQ